MAGALCAVVVMLMSWSGSAWAGYVRSQITSFGSFSNVVSIAVDQSTGDVYVFDDGVGGGTIFKFDSEGNPVSFSSTGTNAITNVGEDVERLDQIAVDGNPLSPAKGDIYVAAGRSTGEITIYSASGEKVGALTKEVETEVPESKAKESWGEGLCGVATDPQGNVYVGMRHKGVINKYTPSGAHPYPVNTDYVGSLWGLSSNPCQLAVDSVGNVFVQEFEAGASMVYNASQINTTKTAASGSVVYSPYFGAGRDTEAVDSSTDELYLDTSESVLQFGPHGEPYGAPKATFSPFGEDALQSEGSHGVAVNGSNSHVYVSDAAGHVNEFGPLVLIPGVTIEPASNIGTAKATVSGTVNPEGVVVTSCVLEYGVGGKYDHSVPCPTDPGSGSSPVSETVELTGLEEAREYSVRLSAHNAQGGARAGESFMTFGRPSVSGVSTGVTKTSATLSGSVDANGFDTTYHFEYGATASYGTSVPVPDVDIGSSFSTVGVGASLTGLLPGTEYHVRLMAHNSSGTTFGPDHAFETVPIAMVQAENVSDIGLDEATLQTRIAALGDDTTYHFDYGLTSAYGSSVPVPDGDVGTGSLTVSQLISGLQSGATYHYRVVATNVLGSVNGEDRTFTTTSLPTVAPGDNCPNASRRLGGVSEALPDCRAYELVTPLDKNGSNIGASTLFTSEAAVDGQRVSFIANSGFGDTTGSEANGFVRYIATRGPDGWSSHSITPPTAVDQLQNANEGVTAQALAFTGSLDQAIYIDGPVPGADRGTGMANLYREQAASRIFETVTLDVLHCECFTLEATNQFAPVGYSSDASVTTFQTSVRLLPEAHGETLYEWRNGTLKVAGVLPDGTVPPRGSAAAAGTVRGELIKDHNSVSSDGSRVLFVSPAGGSSPPQLYMRKNGTSTVWLSRSWTSSPVAEPAGVHFLAASGDDTKVVFSSETPLLNSDTGGGDTGIYLYTDTSENAESESKLTLIARVSRYGRANAERPAGAVAGMSEDATHIFFYNGIPRPSTPSREGEYLWDNGTLHFVAQLTQPIDPMDEEGEGAATAVRVSSDGRRMAFPWRPDPETEPEVAKPGPHQDNTEGHFGLYVYDEGSGKLTCASCPPDGSPMTSDAVVASFVNGVSVAGASGQPFLQRYMSSDGHYVFFSTEQSLLPQDTNGLADVYEYDTDTGVLRLISSGTGESGSWFEDASANGSDVFFLTAQKLTGWDTDTLTDLYDARVNGGFPEPSPPPVPCDGDACQGVPSAVPSFNTASGFSGLGNQHPSAAVVKSKAKPGKHVKRRHGKKRRKGHAGKAKWSRVHGSNRTGR
jgi:hypothetical protein